MGMKKGKKLIAIFMAALMVIGIMPMDWAADKVSAADVKTYTFDATALTAAADKEELTGKVADGFVTVFGSVQKRTSSTDATKVTSTEIAKDAGSGYEFTITGTATVNVDISSTGGSNTSGFSIVNAEGTAVADKTGAAVIEVKGSADGKMTVSYELEAGTYKMVSPMGWKDSAGKTRGTRIYGFEITEVPVSVTTTYAFDATALTATADKEELTGKVADEFVTVFGSVQKRTSSTDVTKVTSTEIAKDAGGGYEFTITGTATVNVDISSTGGSNTSAFSIVNAEGAAVADKNGATVIEVTGSADGKMTVSYELEAGTYKMVSPSGWADSAGKTRGTRVYGFEITETTGGERPARADWNTVTDPALGEITINGNVVTVPYTMMVGYDGADTVTVSMKDAAGTVVASESNSATSAGGAFSFSPKATGTYTFEIKAAREGEQDKVGAAKNVDFVLPLAAPSFQSATSKGGGKVEVVWNEVAEADSYNVSWSADGTTYSAPVSVVGTSYIASGLTVGTTYTFKLTAVRNNPAAETSAATIEALVTDKAQTTWAFAAFGQGVTSSSENCGYSGSVNTDGKATVWNLNSKGKLVPAATDGLSFYYTAVPANKNFTLTAKAHVDEWTYTNGQEGFGLMASDAVGTHGDNSAFWNNSYMASVTKVEYYAESDGTVTLDTVKAGTTPNVPGNKISMKLGVGSQEKTGVTKENLPLLQANNTDTINNEFSSKMTTLDYSCAGKDTGTYNIVGNYTNTKEEFTNTVVDTQTTFDLKIQKNNTGYFVSYTDQNGNTVTKKYYDTKALEELDNDYVYAGLFASRSCKVTFEDVQLTTIDPADDEPAEERPVTEVIPSYKVASSTVANTAAYTLKYVSNADGHVVIKNADGEVVADTDVTANTTYSFDTKLALGDNQFTVTAVPNEGYRPSEYEVLSSYEEVTFTHKVTYNYFTGDIVYAGPEGTSKGQGTKENPMDIYTATKFVNAGQKIVLLGGTYNLESTVTIQPGIDGTADNMIYLVADPDSTERPVLDFGKNCEGMVIAGDYWYIQGFDVTNSANGKDGIRLSGSNCVMDNMYMYHNGNTGLQISRYASTDAKEEWPANNLVLNCTSYGNADAGYEDADGFAAKLTIGEGNVFDGCIAYNNADDGWDLFAKPETGPIGSVTVQNCVAYANGYLEDGTNAGNGNGFKLGGSSITGYHKLINSVAFDNKAKGIDSNSCPDIQVTKCTSYNNGHLEKQKTDEGEKIYSVGSNVALYTNDAANTDFMATGVLSYRTAFTDIAENFKFKGSQDASKVYNDTNYFWMFAGEGANNSQGTITNDCFVSVDTKRMGAAPAASYTEEDFNAKWTYSESPISRNADNTINMNGLLVLSEAGRALVGDKVGADMGGQASAVIDITGAVTNGLYYSPKTGDSANVWMYVLLLVAALGCAGGCAFVSYKKKHSAK